MFYFGKPMILPKRANKAMNTKGKSKLIIKFITLPFVSLEPFRG